MRPQETLRQIAQAFRLYREATASPATREHDRWCLRYVLAYLDQCNAPDLRTACLQFLVWLRQQRTAQGEPLQQGSIATIAGRFQHMLRWAVDEGYLTKLPLRTKELPPPPEPAPEPLTPAEIERLLSAVHGRLWTPLRNRAILIVLLETGCRLGELIQMRVVDAERGYSEVIQKGNRPHTLWWTSACVEAVETYLSALPFPVEPHEPLWREWHGAPLGEQAIYLMIRSLGRRAGIHLYPHRLRQTSATLRLAAGAPTEVVRRALGHSSEKALRHYVKLADSQQRALLEATSPIKLIRSV